MSDDHPTSHNKRQMPRVLKELGEKAIKRHERRQATPPINVTTTEGTWSFGSPFREEDEDYWVALLFEAFGTRSQATFRTFTNQLAQLCSTDWNEDSKAWHPNEDELVASIQIVRSTRPRNEAEACLAAQMVAVHLMQIRLSAQALKHSWPEPRTCAIAGKLARTYAMQLETISKLKGKGSRQRITVRKYSQHEHKHIHLHQGGSENDTQPHGPSEAVGTQGAASRQLEQRASLRSSNAQENGLPMPSSERKEPMPSPRRRGLRSSDG